MTQAAVCYGAGEKRRSEMTSTKSTGLDMSTVRMVIDDFDNSIDLGWQHYSLAGDFLPTMEKCLETFLLDGSIKMIGPDEKGNTVKRLVTLNTDNARELFPVWAGGSHEWRAVNWAAVQEPARALINEIYRQERKGWTNNLIVDARTGYGPDKGIFQINVGQEIERFFDDSSIPMNGQPEFILILGPVCSGKTTLRRQQYSKGYVLIDAAEIFLSLSRGNYFEFGEAFEEPMEFIGNAIVQRAIKERRNIVTEMTGGSNDINTIIDAMTELNYKGQVPYVHCDLEEAKRRNRKRGNDNISAYYTGRYHERWILNASGKSL